MLDRSVVCKKCTGLISVECKVGSGGVGPFTGQLIVLYVEYGRGPESRITSFIFFRLSENQKLVGFWLFLCNVEWRGWYWLASKSQITYRADRPSLFRSPFLSSTYTYNLSDICAELRSLDKLSSEMGHSNRDRVRRSCCFRWVRNVLNHLLDCSSMYIHVRSPRSSHHPRGPMWGQNTLTTPQKAQTVNVKRHLPSTCYKASSMIN